MKKLICLLLLILVSCASSEAFQPQFPVPISDYFYENKGNQTHFIIEFKQAIPDEIKLEKLYFRNQAKAIKMISSQKAETIFTKPDLILDADSKEESTNKVPNVSKTRFQLKTNEAVLEYRHKGKTNYYLFSNVVEKANQ